MKNMEKIKFDLSVLLIIFLTVSFSYTVYAAEEDIGEEIEITFVGNKTTEDAVYVYLKGAESISPEDLKVQAGTELCENVQTIQADEIKLRTLFILDNSRSTAKNWGNDGDAALKLMNGIVDVHLPNEEFKVITYATGVTELTTYTNDYLTLQSVIKGIKYENQDSYIKDTLYTIVNEISEDTEETFYRIVLIADGVENNQITYTDSEIESQLRAAGVPLYAVSVKAGNNTSQLEAMQSYSRLSGGRSWIVSGKGDKDGVDQLLQDFTQENTITCLKIVPPRQLQNGSRDNSIKISITGQKDIVVDNVRMPFASEPTPTQYTPMEPIVIEKEPVITPAPEEIPVEEPGWFEKNRTLLIGAAAGVLVLIVAIVLIVVLGKKKKEEEKQNEFTYIPEDDGDGPTVILGRSNTGSGDTVGIWNNSPGIVLTDVTDPSKVFRASIIDRIVIGRKRPADIVLDFDQAVSSAHCEISKRGGQYYLKDLGSSNKTFYNNEIVESETAIEEGGIITIGRNKYRFSVG